MVAIIYYYKLCKHVKRRVSYRVSELSDQVPLQYQSVGVMGGVAQSLSPSATKYVTQDQHTRWGHQHSCNTVSKFASWIIGLYNPENNVYVVPTFTED